MEMKIVCERNLDILADPLGTMARAEAPASADVVVVGGGLGERLGTTWLRRIEKAAKRHTFFRDPPEYRPAELGDMGGAIGASLLARAR